MSGVEQVRAWQKEWEAYPDKHWGDDIAWGTALAIAQRLEDAGLLVPRRWAGVIPLVEHITGEEGATVTFTHGNPDFNDLPDEVVTVMRGPKWEDEQWRGKTLRECLQAAVDGAEW